MRAAHAIDIDFDIDDDDIIDVDDEADFVDVGIGVDEAALDAVIVRRLSVGDVEVPPFPRAVLELQELQAKGAGANAFVDVVARDPALAVRCLRVANSARYARAHRSVTVHDAVGALGTQMLMRIALADGLAGAACGDGRLVALKDRLWRQSVTAAVLASALAPSRGLGGDLAFICALLHDFGRLIAAKLVEEIVANDEVAAAADVDIAVWDEVVGRYSAELGILAAERWQLPEAIRECISTHRQPLSESPHRALVGLVNAVDAVVALLERCPDPSRDDVQRAGAFSTADVDVVWRALPSLPSVLASFAIERAPPRSTTSTTTTLTTTTTPASKALTASTINTQRPRKFVVQSLTGHVVVLTGPEGLTAHQVFLLRFDFAIPTDVWLRVNAVVDRGGGVVEVSAAPFALTDEAASNWWGHARRLARAAVVAAPSRV